MTSTHRSSLGFGGAANSIDEKQEGGAGRTPESTTLSIRGPSGVKTKRILRHASVRNLAFDAELHVESLAFGPHPPAPPPAAEGGSRMRSDTQRSVCRRIAL